MSLILEKDDNKIVKSSNTKVDRIVKGYTIRCNVTDSDKN